MKKKMKKKGKRSRGPWPPMASGQHAGLGLGSGIRPAPTIPLTPTAGSALPVRSRRGPSMFSSKQVEHSLLVKLKKDEPRCGEGSRMLKKQVGDPWTKGAQAHPHHEAPGRLRARSGLVGIRKKKEAIMRVGRNVAVHPLR